MKNFKRWFVAFLAVAIVIGGGYFAADNIIRATGEDPAAVSQDGGEPAAEVAAADAGGTVTQEIVLEAEPEAEETPAEASEEAAAEGEEGVAEASGETEGSFTVAFLAPAVNGGTLTVSNTGFSGSGAYEAEFPAGTKLSFTVKAKEGYTVDKVTDGMGSAIAPASVSGNTFRYEIIVNDNTVLTVAYAEKEAEGDKDGEEESGDEEEEPDAEPAEAETEGETEPAGDAEDEAPSGFLEAESGILGLAISGETDGETTEAEAITEIIEEMPAQSFFAVAGNGINVRVSAPAGAFPAGTEMIVSGLSHEEAIALVGGDVVDANGVNITFLKDGIEIQPNLPVSVSLSNAGVQGEDFSVVHVDGGAETVTEAASGNGATFAADEFSIYIVTGEGENENPYVCTYVFKVDGAEAGSQAVKDGEDLKEPDAPSKEGYIFKGWYDGDNAVTFGAQTVTKTETKTVNAKFEQAYYVFFMYEGKVCVTEAGASGDTVETAGVGIPFLSENESVTGWYLNEGLTQPAGTITLNNADVKVYPKIETGYWLTFDSDGGTYYEPVFYKAGQNTVSPGTPEKIGYTFGNWKNGNNNYTFGRPLTENVILKASWTAKNNTKYTVLHWQENANDDEYSFKESESKTGTTGANTAATAKSYSGFTAQAITQQKIAGDGSTIVNVYYKRTVYTLTFKDGNSIKATIQAKYGAKIANEFNKAPFTTTYKGRAWKATSTYSYALQTLDVMPAANVTFNLYSKSSNTLKTIYYYGEALDGGPSDTTYKNKKYVQLKTVDTYFNYMTYQEEYHDIEGFTRWSQSDAGFRNNEKSFSNNRGDLYYSRNSYSIEFNNNGTKDQTKNYKYEASISGAGYTPSRPSGIPEGYTFVGWYDNALGEGSAYNFSGKTMPAHNIILYAKWKAPEYEVKVQVTIAGSSAPTEITVKYGEKLDQSKIPAINKPDGYRLIGTGWRDVATGKQFSLDTVIYKNYTIEPYLVKDGEGYQVTYKDGSKTYTDSQIYLDDSRAKLVTAATAGFTAPAGMVFLGWEGEGGVYQPGDKIPITGDVTLTAKWGPTPTGTSLTYKPNGGTGNDATEQLKNNQKVTLKSAAALGYTREGYEFLGWSTNASATTPEFTAGQKVVIDNKTGNTLFAVWKQSKAQYTVEYYLEGDDGSFSINGDATKNGTGNVGTVINFADHQKSFDGYVFGYSQPSSVTLTTVASQNILKGYYYKVRAIEVQAKDAEVTYNGTEQTVNPGLKQTTFTIAGKTYTVEGLSTSGKGTNAGTYDINVTGPAKVYDSNHRDVTSRFTVTKKKGTLTVKKANVVLTSANLSKVYDGTALVNGNTALAVETGWVNGEGATYSFTGSQKVVGESSNTFTYILKEGTSADNYNITATPGTLKVTDRGTKYEVTVKANSDTATYDGLEHSATGVETYTFVVEGNTYTVSGLTTEDPVKTDAGEYTNNISGTAVVKDSENNVVTDQFIVNKVNGKLIINKRDVVLKSSDLSKEYDGNALVNGDTALATETGWANGEGATYNFTGSQTEIGSSDNTFEYTLNSNTKEGNYNISKTEGTLTVTYPDARYEIYIVANSDTKTYNGEEQTVTGAKASFGTGGSFVDVNADGTVTFHIWMNDYTVSGITAAGSGTNAGEYTVSLSDTANMVVTDKNNQNVTEHFAITGSNGTLKIDKKKVELTSADDTQKYNGSALTNGTVTVTDGGWVGNDGVVCDVTGTQTVVGESENGFTYTALEGTNLNNYDISTKFGTLTVTKRDVTLTSATDSKMYDGSALTNSNVIEGGDGFAPGEGADYTVTGTQTDPGSSNNTFTYTLKEGTLAGNYNISTSEGLLTVIKNTNEITITANSKEKAYDGQPLTDDGFTYTQGIIADGDVLTAVVEGTITDAGTADNVVTSYKVMRGETDVTDYYTFKEPVAGTLKVTKKAVTLKSADLTKEYDGKALVNGDTALAVETGWAEGEGAEYTFTGSQKAIGSSANAFSYTLNSNTKASNYDINKSDGTLTVTNRDAKYEITVKANSGSATYDGEEHSAVGVETYEFTIDGETYTVSGLTTEDPVKTDAGTYTNNITGTAVVKDADNNDVTAQFSVGTENGSLVISKRSVTLTSATDSKTYDGTPLTNNTVTVGGDGFVEGEGATYDVTGSQLDQGSSSNTFSYELNSNTKAGNYNISTNEGTLTVTAITTPIVITAASDSKPYDGSALTNSGFTFTEDVLCGDDILDVTVEGTITDAGTADNVVTSYKVMRNGVDVTGNYVFGDSVKGTLEVTKKAVTLKSADLTKEYDGKALVNGDTALAVETGWAEGEGAEYTFTGSQKAIGSSANAFSYAAKEGTNFNNYEISKSEGTLTVTNRDAKYEVTVKANSGSATYDGEEHSAVGVETYEFTIDGETYTVSGLTTEDPVKTDAGTYTNNITGTAVVKDSDDNVVTEQFTVKTENGSLVINKKAVTLKSADLTKVYDGSALVNGDTALATETGWVGEDGAEYTFTGSQTDIGYSANAFSFVAKEGTNFNNYEISKSEGTLTVTAIETPIIITAGSDSRAYNGQPFTKDSFTYTEGVLVPGDVLTAVVEGSITDVGTADNVVTSYKVMRGSEDVTANYTFGKSVKGTLEVTKRSVTLTSATDSKTYDGTPLTNDTVTVGGDGFVEGEGATYDVTGSQLDQGSSPNTFSYKLKSNTKAGNYNISTNEGTLTVTAITTPIVITPNSKTEMYNGTPLTDDGYTYTEEVLVDGDVLTAVVEGTITDVGTVENVVTSYKVMRGNTEVTGNYTFGESAVGQLTVTKRAVTLTSADDTQVYNGKALTNDTVTVSGDGFAPGEGYTADVTGSITNVGTADNTFTYALNEGTKADNYQITPVYGELEVTKKAATLTSATQSWEYDGNFHKAETVTPEGFVGSDADSITYSDFAQIKKIGNIDNTFTYSLAEDIKKNYDISVIPGTLSVTNRDAKYEITVKANSTTATYDGEEHSATGVETLEFTVEGNTYTVSGLKTNDPVETDANTYPNNITGTAVVKDADNEDVTAQFTVNIENGSLVIKPAEVILKSADLDKIYDETALVNGDTALATESGWVGEDGAEYTFTGSQTLVGESANSFSYELKEGTKSTNYTIKKTEGTLKVTDELDPDDYDLSVNKSHEAGKYGLNDVVTFNISVKNIYDEAKKITLTEIDGVTLAQSVFENVGAGETVQTTATYKITENDILNQSFTNTVKASFDGGKSYEAKDTVTPEEIADKDAKLKVEKTSDFKGKKVKPGDEITYSITVTNTGNLTISDIAVTDELVNGTWSIDSLAPGADKKFTANYTVTEMDILNGSVVNKVTAAGKDPENKKVSDEDTYTDNTVDPDRTLEVVKTSDVEGAAALNQVIHYTITVTNKGNLTYSNIKVTDELTGFTDTIDTLAPGKSKEFTTSYTVTEQDILEGSVLNVVTAAGKDPGNNDVTGEGEKKDNTDKVNGSLNVEKTSDVKGTASLNDDVTYSITVTNNGNVTVSDITVADELTGDTWSIDSLAPGEKKDFSTVYKVTEADILNQQIVNKATAAGKDPNGKDVTGEKEITDNTDAINGSVLVTKNSDVDAGGTAALNQKITYSINVKNNGNVTLSNVAVTDPLTGFTDTIDSLAPGEYKDFTTSYTVTEADILNQKVVNKATAEGTDPNNNPVSGEDSVTDKTDAVNGDLTITKVSDLAAGDTASLKDEITYSIVVTNSGNVTVSNIAVADELTGDTWSVDSLAPGAYKEFTAKYTVTETDILNHKVVNKATAEGTDPNEETVKADVTTEDPTDAVNNKIVIEKTSDVTGTASLDDVVTYTITVTNVGNVTISNIAVVDDLTGDSWTIDSLAPGAYKEFSTQYKVTEKEILKGKVVNKATASGTDPNGTPTGDTVETEDPTDPVDGHIVITKDSNTEGKVSKAGDVITYTVTVKNAGNVTLHDVVVTDPMTGAKWTMTEDFAPGAVKTYNTNYEVSEEDILTDSGKVTNIATATGKDPNGDDPKVDPGEKDDPVEVTRASLYVEKVAAPAEDGEYNLNDVITYTINVVNNGNVTVSGIVLTDSLTGEVFNIGELKPGAAADEITVQHKVTEEDLVEGEIVNVAEAVGKDPKKNEVSAEDTVIVDPEEANPQLAVEKTSKTQGKVKLGEEITYTITVTNVGNLTFSDATVTDELTGDEWTIPRDFVPGDTETFTTTYVVQEKDIRAGKVLNVATADGEVPGDKDPDPTPGDVEDPTDDPDTTFTVVKEILNAKSEYKVGDKIEYSITVENKGNVTLFGLTLTDQMIGTKGAVNFTDLGDKAKLQGGVPVISSLAPGEKTTILCSYTVVRSDANAALKNKVTVTGTGTDPDNPPGEKDPEIKDPDPRQSTTGESDIEKEYTVIVHHRNEDGGIIAEDTVERHLVGEQFYIPAKDIEGFVPITLFVASDENGMPARNLELDMIYSLPGPQGTTGILVVSDDDGGYALTEIAEDEVPLAGGMDEHVCCILHFLLMLAAFLILCWYTHNAKKHQKRIFELQEQLNKEQASRGMNKE